MIAQITADEIRRLFNWLRDHHVNYDPCRLHRDFSDCVKVAKLLHKFYPRLVDLHNYPKRNNTTTKIDNWETLNFKVLNKIGLTLNAKRIENLVHGKPGAIEQLLWRIMQQDLEHKRKLDNHLSEQEQVWSENDDVVWAKVKRFANNGSIVESTEKLILYSIYDDARRDSIMLSKEIAAKQQEIAHLEKLSALKAEHLLELTDRAMRRFDVYSSSDLDFAMSENEVPSLDLKNISTAESRSLPGSTRTKKGNHSY